MNIELRGGGNLIYCNFPFIIIKFLGKYLVKSSSSRNGPLRSYFHLAKLLEKQEPARFRLSFTSPNMPPKVWESGE